VGFIFCVCVCWFVLLLLFLFLLFCLFFGLGAGKTFTYFICKTSRSAHVNHSQILSLNQPVLSNEGKHVLLKETTGSCDRVQTHA